MALRNAHDGLHGVEAHHEAAEQDAVRRGLDRELVFTHRNHAGLSQLEMEESISRGKRVRTRNGWMLGFRLDVLCVCVSLREEGLQSSFPFFW